LLRRAANHRPNLYSSPRGHGVLVPRVMGCDAAPIYRFALTSRSRLLLIANHLPRRPATPQLPCKAAKASRPPCGPRLWAHLGEISPWPGDEEWEGLRRASCHPGAADEERADVPRAVSVLWSRGTSNVAHASDRGGGRLNPFILGHARRRRRPCRRWGSSRGSQSRLSLLSPRPILTGVEPPANRLPCHQASVASHIKARKTARLGRSPDQTSRRDSQTSRSSTFRWPNTRRARDTALSAEEVDFSRRRRGLASPRALQP